MRFGIGAAAIAVALSACTPGGDQRGLVASPTPQRPGLYRVDFGPRGGGVVELHPDGVACLNLRGRLPKAAHLHERPRPPDPTGSLLVTFAEPPNPTHRRTCTDGDPSAREFVADNLGRVFVDLHYNPRDEGVVGRLSPMPVDD